MPARTLYPACVVVGVLGGLIGALALSKRNQVRLFLLAFWPIGVVTIFFAAVGTFDFSELSFAELLNFEFAFMWCGALWAFIVLKPGVTPTPSLEQEIKNFVKVRLAAHEFPREVEFVGDLPMTATGKIMRKELRKLEEERKRIKK